MKPASRSKTWMVLALVVLALAAGLGLSVCGDDGGGGGGNGAGTTTSTAEGGGRSALQREAEGVTGALLGAGKETPAVASAEGMVDTLGGPTRMQPAVAEILAVEVEESAILLRWRLKSKGAPLQLRPTTFSSEANPSTSVSEVVLVSPAGKESAKPYRNRQGEFGIVCVCSTVPNEVDGTGQELTGLYPSFSQVPTEVEVQIPGFPPITEVAVTRR